MTTYRRIDAVRKAADILKMLSNQKTPVTGGEVAQACGIPVATAMSHIATLGDAGFVESVGDGYRLGAAAAMLWARVKGNLEGDKARIERSLTQLEDGE